eukprot:NODE_159_length_16647_cov_0.251390.p5 type:complete len:438 gc:universal NODE_159_length_16647_cov_0.251390:8715-10028(+)
MTISHQNRQGLQSDLAVKVHCDNCAKNVSNIVRIKCAECQDFDLCVECFSQGVETQLHKNNHDYHICDPLAFPIFQRHWSASEELLLLEAINEKGMGNFSDISVYLGSKSIQECKDHYYEVYVDSDYFPVPNLNKMLKDIKPIPYREEDHKEIAQELINKPTPSVPANHDVGGYLAGRFEFDAEYDAEAENVIKDLEILPDDSDEERRLKITLMDIYQKSLDLKYSRRMLMLERGLHDYKANSAIERKRTAEERVLHNQIKPFHRLMTKQDTEIFLDGLDRSFKMKQLIDELNAHRRHKIYFFHTLEEKKKKKEDIAKQVTSIPSSAVLTMNAPVEDRPPSLDTAVTIQSTSQNRPAFDVTTSENANLLDASELSACGTLRILPKHYLILKHSILSYKEPITLKSMIEVLKLPEFIATGLFEFWKSSGIIKDKMEVE